MAENANQSLPRAALLLTQGAAYVRQHDQRVRHAVLAEGTLAHHPARIRCRVGECDQRLIPRLEAGIEFELGGCPAKEPRCRLLQKAFARRVHQPQDVIGIEGEERGIDLIHDPAKKRCGFDGLDALLGEDVGECVDLQRQLAEGVVGYSAAGPKGVILFAKRADNISQSLQWADNLIEQHNG